MRKRYSADFKARVALEALRGLRPIHEIARKHGVHPNQISVWKRQAIEGLREVFSGRRDRKDEQEAELRDRLYQQIGELQVELEWLRKKSNGLG